MDKEQTTNAQPHIAEQEKDRRYRQMATIFVVLVTAFSTSFTASALNLSIPAISSEFHVSAILIGWIVTAFMLTSASFSVPFGRLADLTGRKRILIIGILLFCLCSLGGAFSFNIQSLLFFRSLQGFGAAMIFSTNIAVLIDAFPPEKRGKVLGYSTAATYIGLSAGPVIGGFLNHYIGWRSILITTFIIGMMAFVIALIKLPSQKDLPPVKRSDFDAAGNVLYIAMILCTLYGLSAFSASLMAKVSVAVGVVLFLVFGRHELRVASPVVEIRLFRKNPSYLLSNIAALLNYAATFAIGYLLSIYLQVVKGIDSQIAGMIMITQPLMQALLSPYTGKISDKKSPFILASFGMGLSALGLLGFAFIWEECPLWFIIGDLALVGVGFAFFSSPNTNAIMSCVDKEDFGVASSLLATMRTMGQTSSMAVVTFIVAMQLGSVTLEAADNASLVGTMRIAFTFFTFVCFAGIFISLKRKPSAA